MTRRIVNLCLAAMCSAGMLMVGDEAVGDRGHCAQRTGTCDTDCEYNIDYWAEIAWCEWRVNLTYLKCASSEQCEDCDNEYTNPSENWIYECRVYVREIDPWDDCDDENCSGGAWVGWDGDQIPNACSDCN